MAKKKYVTPGTRQRYNRAPNKESHAQKKGLAFALQDLAIGPYATSAGFEGTSRGANRRGTIEFPTETSGPWEPLEHTTENLRFPFGC